MADRVAFWIITLVYTLLILFGGISLCNPGWLQNISDPGRTTEALTHFDRANQEMYKSNFITAASIYEQALKIDTANREIYGNLGIAYTKIQRFGSARKCFNEVKRLSNGLDSMAYFNYYESMGSLEKTIGNHLIKSGKNGTRHLEKALTYYKKAIESMPYEPVLMFKYAHLLMAMKKDSVAIQCFEQGINKNRNNDTHYYSALLTAYVPAIAARDSNNIDGIVKLYNREINWHRFDIESLHLDRKSSHHLANAYLNLGVLYLRNNNRKIADVNFKKALQINPGLQKMINRVRRKKEATKN